MGLFLDRYANYREEHVNEPSCAPDGKDAVAAARMARDVMMSTRSTPHVQQAVPTGSRTTTTTAESKQQQQHASIYSYLHTQSGLNFAPVVPHRQGDSPPPAPPVRDASSLKGVKYGPGHEKFPSWPVSAAADTPAAARSAPGGGSHRSKSWTDHTNYPKEKGLTYTRPYMKRPNPAFTQQLKTVMERCEKLPSESFETRTDVLEDSQGRLYLPHLDREGNALGDMDYLAPSPPERDIEEYKNTSTPLTQADLEEYARTYQPQQQPSYAQSEGYHSYVSSSDSTTTTPFLDRLRRDSEMTSRPVPGPQTPAWDDSSERPGRDSVVTTSSGSASSSETLKWHGSLSDVSVASSSCTQQGSCSSSSRQLIAHSSRVQTPQRHHSESVLYLGSQARVQRNNHHNKLRLFPVNTYTVQPQQEQQGHRPQQQLSPSSQPALSVAERISELERQQMLQTRYTYLDPDKRHRVSDPTLKAIQKKALLSFYERHHHANGQGRTQQAWRSEPQLAQPVLRPQSPPPPQPPPRPRMGGQSPRRASSASDYAGGAWREMAANREAAAAASESNNNVRENSRHQHSSSCGSLSSDLLGPLIMGPSISVDDWVPERPPKKPHLRAAFAPSVPDRLPSPDLPPPSPPPMLEDEVFATDEPLPPPPPDLHPADWSTNEKKHGESACVENSSEIQHRLADRQAEYTNMPPRSPEGSPQRHSENGLSSSHKLSLLRNQEPSHPALPSRPCDLSSLTQRHQENALPSTPSRNSSSRHPPEQSQPDVIPVTHRHHECDSFNSSSAFRPPDSVLQVQRNTDSTTKNLPEICPVEQKPTENSLSHQKHTESSSRNIDAAASHRYLQTTSSRYVDSSHNTSRHMDTGQRYVENGPIHQRLLESGHAIHRHLETGSSSQQKQPENLHVHHRHSSSDTNNTSQKYFETSSSAIHRPAVQRQIDNETVKHTEEKHLAYEQRNEKQCENNHDFTRHPSQEINNKSYKSEDNCENKNHQRYSDNNNSQTMENSSQKQSENKSSSRYIRSMENGNADQRNSPPSPQQKSFDNGNKNQENNLDNAPKQYENGIATSRHVDALHQRYLEGGTLNRRYLESNRSLDGSTSFYRYQDNVQSQKHSFNHAGNTISSTYRNSSGIFSRPSGMRSTENLHHKADSSRQSEHWSNMKYSTQKLVVNGKLATPVNDRSVQNGGFTESVRMSDLNRLSKWNGSEFPSMPARARLQRLPLAVPNGDTISHLQVSPRSPPHSQTSSSSSMGPKSPGHTAGQKSPQASPPSSSLNINDAVPQSSPAGSPTQSQQTTSKASYLASYRRDRDRGLPNFEGSYKRIMSPSGHETSLNNSSNSVPECDRLPSPGEAANNSIEEKQVDLHNHISAASQVPQAVKTQQEPNDTRTKDDIIIERLLDEDGKEKDCCSETSSVVSCSVISSVETEIQCDLITETKTVQQEESKSAKVEDSPPQSPPPSPPVASPPPSPPARSPSPGRISPKVTESLQLVQRSEVVLRVNAATSDASSQTEMEKEVISEVPSTMSTALLVRPKTQEEIECERLSLDLASHLPASDKLQTLLVPDPEHKKPTDYVSGLFRLDVALRPRPAISRTQVSPKNSSSNCVNANGQAGTEETVKDNSANSPVSPLPANSKYFQISEPKAKFLNRYVQDMGQLNGLHDKDLHQKKEELMTRLARKLEVLRGEQLVVMEEATVNDQLGESVAAQVSRVARPHELGKYRLHVEEVGKITSLLLGLSGRLARAENALMGLPLHHSERKILESKRDKLREQLEEAKKLKENIDRRSINVSNILYKYFNSEEYADYDHFINMKAKLIMDSREIADKIKLGEEQLAALKETLCCPSSD